MSTASRNLALERFVAQWAVLLTTFRRDGTPVSTAINLVVDGDHAYFRTYDKAGKAKRLGQRAMVEICPATWRGRPTGAPARFEARLLEGAEAERAGRMIDDKHPYFQRLLVRFGHRVQRYKTLHFEVRPIDG